MPTTVTSSIGTSSRDYSTLQAWEDAAPANLVTSDQIWRGECYNDSEFTSGGEVLTISGSTSDSTRYKELTTATGQSFRDHANVQTNALAYNQSNGVAIRTTGYNTNGIEIGENNVRISKVQVQANGSGNSDNAAALKCNASSYTVTYSIFEQRATSSGVPIGFVTNTGLIANCLFISRASSGGTGVWCYYCSSVMSFVNCTVVRPADKTASSSAFTRTGGSGIVLKNCAAFGFTNEVNGPTGFTATTCRTDKASPMTGFSTIAYDTSTGSGFQNTTDSTRDFRLKSTSAMIDVGTTDATNAPIDIAGTNRPSGSAYDVGAWEYVSAGGGSFKAGKPTVIGQAIGGMY